MNILKDYQTVLRTLSLVLALGLCVFTQAQDQSFNEGWLFFNDQAEGAEMPAFEDGEWRSQDLPHDWAIEGPFDRKYNARAGGLPFYGTGWYRKHFTMPASAEDKVVRVEFEGAMYDAHVWVNGQFIGKRPYGYIGFEFDISEALKYGGEDNVIAVRLTPEDLSSRWYPGAGIYRNVWLKVDEPVHVGHWGTFVTTPTITDKLAVVQIETDLVNKDPNPHAITLTHAFLNAEGEEVATTSEEFELSGNANQTVGHYVNIPNPQRWDLETPYLYKAVTTISQGGKTLDTYETRFGIRTISYDVDGFYLNGRKVRFNGVCLHHDNGALGAAVYRRADERKLQIMKDMGVNAIRTSHNPPSTTFLELL